MALDGLTMYGITKELSEELTGSKIDKISQAENDEILLTCRGKGKNLRLLISASSMSPRLYLVSDYKKENPLKAPTFLMILRKYIQSGRILSVTQEGLERIIRIDIDTLDDLKFPKVRSLVVEIMGRHSNIILIDKESNKILDSVKRIPITVSSVREVLPGKEYALPPSQGKLNPLTQLDQVGFVQSISDSTAPAFKALYSLYDGISPVIAKEICHRAGVDFEISGNKLIDLELDKMYQTFHQMMHQIQHGNFEPVLIMDSALGKLVDFSLVRLTMYDFLQVQTFDSISQACESFYTKRDNRERMGQRTSSLKKLLSNKIERLENKLGKQLQELQDTEDMDSYREKADILTASVYLLKKGLGEISLEDFYKEDMPLITISLDSDKSPSENIQHYYKRYNKLKKRKQELTLQVASAQEELDYLQNVMLSIEEADSGKELEDIRVELYQEGYLKARGIQKKQKESKTTDFLEYRASDGTMIYIGKNNRQNDTLTLKTSSPDDVWLHTKNIPGSHVIIKATLDKVSDFTLVEAATLAAYHSKARQSSKVPVDYTSRKNVKKPAGAKPGMVIYDHYSTLYVNPQEDVAIKLKATKEADYERNNAE